MSLKEKVKEHDTQQEAFQGGDTEPGTASGVCRACIRTIETCKPKKWWWGRLVVKDSKLVKITH